MTTYKKVKGKGFKDSNGYTREMYTSGSKTYIKYGGNYYQVTKPKLVSRRKSKPTKSKPKGFFDYDFNF